MEENNQDAVAVDLVYVEVGATGGDKQRLHRTQAKCPGNTGATQLPLVSGDTGATQLPLVSES